MNYASETWEVLRREIASNLSETSMNTWFDEVQAVDIKDNSFVLCCPNEFKRSMIESHFLPDVKNALHNLFSADFDVRVLSLDERDSYQGNAKPHQQKSSQATFSSFIVGNSNILAYSTARAVADNMAERYNPLLIYGASGLGKTHLMQAIANEVKGRDKSIRVIDTSGNMLTNDLVTAIRERTTSEMRQKYLDSDLLLVDDIQFIAGKTQTQEEFFNTFNALYSTGCQIVLTSDRPPRDMKQLDERLRTRFEGGMMADITRPDYETRLAMVTSFAASAQVLLNDSMAERIAQSITDNVRQLKGVINKVDTVQEISRHPLSMTEFEEILNAFCPRSETSVSINDVITEVSRFYGVSVQEIAGTSRTRNVALARNVAMFLAYNMLGKSSNEIGAAFHRDHSTVLHSLKKISKEIGESSELSERIEDLKANIAEKNH